MSEPAQTTYEEATRCPGCEVPGRLVNKRLARSEDALPGTQLHLFECHNDRCPDFLGEETLSNGDKIPATRNRWFIQVNANGTVPPRGSGAIGPKAFSQTSPHSAAAINARDQLRLVASQDEMTGGYAKEILGDLGYRGGY